MGRDGVRPEIWSYGHRNQQGPRSIHGAACSGRTNMARVVATEINIPQAGKNYGWPLATHGINYSMLPIPEAGAKP